MLIAQFTDFHVPAKDVPPRDGFDPAADLAHAVLALNALDPQPDLVIATGDLTDKSTPEEYAHLTGLLKPLKAPLYAIPGNHDAKAPMVEALTGLAVTGPAEPFVHTALDFDDPAHGPLRLILVDSHQHETVGGVQCAERLAWLEGMLAGADDSPVVIAMHHPPFELGIPVFDRFGFEGMDAFRALVSRFPTVSLIMCGHIHRALTTTIATTPVFVCPSVAHGYPLERRPGYPLNKSPEPPGIALHQRTAPATWVSHVVPIRPRG